MNILASPSTRSTSQGGFTLLEMLIATVVMMMMTGIGLASYLRFTERQTLRNAGKELQTYMRAAQSRARSGDRPTGCAQLFGYAVTGANGGVQIQLSAVCENGVEVVTDTYTLPSGSTLGGALDMTFGSLKGGVTGAGTVTLISGAQEYEFTVSQGGEIGDGDIVAQ